MSSQTITYQEATKDIVTEVVKKLDSSPVGLSTSQVEKRGLVYGKNRLEEREEKIFTLLLRQFQSPFIYLLLVAGFVSFFLGEVIDSLLIFLFVCLNTLLGFFQEFRSHQAVKLLKHFLIHECLVIRDQQTLKLRSEELVPGDIVLLRAGDKIPADVRFIEVDGVSVDESILTGESKVADKNTTAVSTPIEDYFEATNIGFSGTLVTRGKGKAIVIATGINSELGNIVQKVLTTKSQSAFEIGIGRFSRFILQLSVGTIVVIFLFNLVLKGDSFNSGEFLVFSLALIIGVIPEALPLVTTVSLSSGALRLARKKVVPKRLSSIEDLGSIDILATDKTGTITENRLTVAEVYSDQPRETLKLAILASAFFSTFSEKQKDPLELAIWESLLVNEQKEVKTMHRLREKPFDPVRKRASALVEKEAKKIVVSLGAWEDLTHDQPEFTRFAKEQGESGRRILAVGKKEVDNEEYSEDTMELVGLISFIDPLKRTAKRALIEAKKLGIQVKILTGDSADVSASVAREIGLIGLADDIVVGKEWRTWNREQKGQAAKSYQVFARLTPEDKYDIVGVLKDLGFTVGFLGEGFNDAPALELSHVGLAVQSASDIAQEAADIILLNKSLEVIIDGVREGRQTFANTFKYIKNTLTSNFGNFYTLAIASLLIKFLPMLPTQILLVNLLSDFPMVSIAGDTVDKQELLRPRGYAIKEIAFFATMLGLVSTVIDFGIFGYFLRFGEHVLQTMWFIGSILTELVIFYSIRTRGWFFKGGRPASLIVLLTLFIGIVTIAIPFTTVGQSFFGFVSPRIDHLFIVVLFVLAYFLISEVSKILYYKSFTSSKVKS